MRGSAALGLHEGSGLRQHAPRCGSDGLLPGSDHDRGVGAAGFGTAASTWASSERPATSCSTLGAAERMRVPSPAASTIARQVRAFIEQNAGVIIAGWRLKVAIMVPRLVPAGDQRRVAMLLAKQQ